jgi:hypothetical protein
MAVPGLFWIELGLGVVLLLLAAKVHGRQIRLERELEGYFDIDFMRENDPWVEALWRTDRRQFRIAFPVAAVVLASLVAAMGSSWVAARFGSDPLGSPLLGAIGLAVLLWAPVAAFVANGFASAWRFHRRLNEPRPQGRRRDEVLADRGHWLATAVRGTYAWWGFLGAVGVATVVIAAIG